MDQTVKKGNRMIGFLRRNLKVSNESTKTVAYLTLVRPILVSGVLLQSGAPTPKTISTSLKWSRVARLGLLQLQTIPQHQQRDLHVGTFRMGITGIETCQV